MTLISNWDRELLLSLNSFGGHDSMYLWDLANNALFRGFPVFFSIVVLWFSGDHKKRRSRMLAGILAVCLATILSLWIQFHVATHTRPLLDPALSLRNIADPQWSLGWERKNSFPNDTASLFFALATVVFLENPLVGLFCFLWVAAIIAIPRVVFGWHYPSDIIGSLVLGPALVICFNVIPYPRILIDRALMLFEGRMYIVHALLFIFLADAFHLFISLQELGKQFTRMLG